MKYKVINIAKEISERENDPAHSELTKFVGLEHYVPGDIVISKYGSTENLDSAMKIFKSGDILIARRNVYLKRASTVLFDGLTSGDSIVLRATDPHIQRLLPFVFNTDSFWDYADKYADGSMSRRLSPKILLQYEFQAPDTSEAQDELADLLWSISETKSAYQELLVQSDELIKARFVEMFGDPIDNPLGWKKCRLQEVVKEDCTISYGIVKPGDPQENGVPVFRPVDIVNHKPKLNELKKTTEEISNQYSRTILTGRELLITVRANIGDTFITNKEFAGCNVGRGITPIRTKEDVIVLEFLQLQLSNKHFREYINSLAKGITLRQLNMEDLRNIKIIVPPIDKQNGIVLFAKQVDKSKSALQKAIDDLDVMYKRIIKENLG